MADFVSCFVPVSGNLKFMSQHRNIISKIKSFCEIMFFLPLLNYRSIRSVIFCSLYSDSQVPFFATINRQSHTPSQRCRFLVPVCDILLALFRVGHQTSHHLPPEDGCRVTSRCILRIFLCGGFFVQWGVTRMPVPPSFFSWVSPLLPLPYCHSRPCGSPARALLQANGGSSRRGG